MVFTRKSPWLSDACFTARVRYLLPSYFLALLCCSFIVIFLLRGSSPITSFGQLCSKLWCINRALVYATGAPGHEHVRDRYMEFLRKIYNVSTRMLLLHVIPLFLFVLYFVNVLWIRYFIVNENSDLTFHRFIEVCILHWKYRKLFFLFKK